MTPTQKKKQKEIDDMKAFHNEINLVVPKTLFKEFEKLSLRKMKIACHSVKTLLAEFNNTYPLNNTLSFGYDYQVQINSNLLFEFDIQILSNGIVIHGKYFLVEEDKEMEMEIIERMKIFSMSYMSWKDNTYMTTSKNGYTWNDFQDLTSFVVNKYLNNFSKLNFKN